MNRVRVLAVSLFVILLTGCTAAVPAAPRDQDPAAQSSPASAAGTVSCDYQPEGGAARTVDQPSASDVPASGTVDYLLTLNDTPLTLTLDRAKAPCTVHSFESLAAQGYFDGTVCHRLTTAGIFVLQCGDPTATGTGGPGYTIPDELDGITGYPAGTLAMARTQAPHSGGSQFFIVYADTPLPADYTVFGTVDPAGVAVVAKLAAGGTDGAYGSPADGVPSLSAAVTSVKPA